MKKKISIPIVPVIILIIAIVIIIMVLINGAKDDISKLCQIYNKMVENDTYVFARYDFEEKNKLVNYRKKDNTLIDMYNSGEHLSTLVTGGDTYLIRHEYKEYYVYPNNNVDEGILTNNLKNITQLEYTEGKEKIYGKTYKYEEYEGVSDFLINSTNYAEDNAVKTRFYFDGKKLVYLKTLYEVEKEETGEKTQEEELLTVEVKYEVEDSVFKIPSDYAEN